jgi:hypothetical protein
VVACRASLLSLGLAVPAKSQGLPFGNGDVTTLECQIEGQPTYRWLDGRTAESTVGLAPTTTGKYTGTRCQVFLRSEDSINLKCLGTGTEGNRWLVGRRDRAVGLAPQADSPATKWKFRIVPQ